MTGVKRWREHSSTRLVCSNWLIKPLCHRARLALRHCSRTSATCIIIYAVDDKSLNETRDMDGLAWPWTCTAAFAAIRWSCGPPHCGSIPCWFSDIDDFFYCCKLFHGLCLVYTVVKFRWFFLTKVRFVT